MIYLGSDHRGFELKEKIKDWLKEWSYQYEDMGPFEYNKDDDYPDFAKAVADKVVLGGRGIIICGSGIGIAVAANKVKGVRAGTAMESDQIKAAVHDEDINVLALPADFLSEDKIKDIVKSFIEAKFGNEDRYNRRLDKIKQLEQ